MNIAILILAFIGLLLGFIGVFQNKKKPVEKIVKAIRNVNNNWISPLQPPEDRLYNKVIVTVLMKDGKTIVTDSIYDKTRGRFTGLTHDFHENVIAWMPYPEPYNESLILIKNDNEVPERES